MRIAICEDSNDHAIILKAMIDHWAERNDVAVDVRRFKSAEDFVFHWPSACQFDIAFLDIKMAVMNGMELAQYIRAQDKAMLLVFTTGLKGYVFRGYEVSAFRYLLKPIKEEECYNTLNKARDYIANKDSETFVIMQEGQSIRLYKDEIIYFEVQAHYVLAHTIHDVYRYKDSLTHIESLLVEPHFCRCHRAYLVNLRHVRVINRNQVQMQNMVCLPVSRNRWAPLNECFIKFYIRRT